MPTTGIQLVYKDGSDNYMFVKLEDTRNNRYVESSPTNVGDCWVPWCNNREELLKKGIVLINLTQGTLAGFIWQQVDAKGDDRVRFSTKGWEAPTVDNRIPGESRVGIKINLKIDPNGKISAEQASVFAAEQESPAEVPAEA